MKRIIRKRSYKYLYLAIGFIIGGILFFGSNNHNMRNKLVQTVMGYAPPESTTILVVGQDSIKPLRSDTIILLCLNTKSEEILLFSIPRDTRIEVPGNGYDKVNHSYAKGGIQLLKETIEKNLDIHIPYTVEINYQGFEKVIDLLGGVEIDVESDMKYTDRAQDLVINISAGKQRLKGDKALQYVRYRNDKLGDIGRIKRQQNFLQALFHEIDNPLNLPKMPQIIQELRQALITNFSNEELINLGLWFKDLNERVMITDMMPGEAAYIEGVSYWEPDLDTSKKLVTEFFLKEKRVEEQPNES